ncbi:MAG: carbohydrate binding family 9 domain-containing protein, partial [Gemmatimonadaceae bacterium]|nr:carbohydrate binding family 9 domain-containing protein [Gemmatimonadaceae bacterium]
LARRDATSIYSDWIHVIVDSYHDRRNAFRFAVNPLGVQKDVLHSDDRSEDLNWDAVWEVATSIDSAGWTAEYRIPLSQLRFGSAQPGEERIWGLQVQRDIARTGERDSWSPWKRADPGFVSFAGDLTGIVDIPTPRRVEFVPYTSTKVSRAPGNPKNPFYRSTDVNPSVGGDIKFGLPSGLTLNATVNPDFGQVEVDPAVVNLSAFESFFPEKRPFFVEGASIFNIGSVRSGPSYGFGQIFYSRRIGRAPQRFVSGVYVDAPDATTILGATKLSGKSGPWTVGFLDAVTAKETARVDDGKGLRTSAPVEPMTNYFVGRVRRDYRGGKTIVGIGGTAVNRDLKDPGFKNLLRSRAEVGSLDFEHRFWNGQWQASGALSASSIGGSQRVITNSQRSSSRYFQRPDADYLGVDSSRNGLSGNSLVLGLTKAGNFSMSATAKQISPGYEVNDLGFMGRVDYRNLGGSASYSSFTPGKLFRDFNYGAGTNHAWNYGGDKIWSSYFNYFNATLNNLWYLGGGSEYNPGNVDDRLTRGGPEGRQPTQGGVYLYGGTDSKRRLPFNLNLAYFGDSNGGYSRSVNPGVDYRPSSSIKLSFQPGISRFHNTIQFVQSVSDPNMTATFGRRYVFADLYQTTLSATTRVEWTLTRNLSFQMYAQPFASSGDYRGFKELAARAVDKYNTFGEGSSTITPVTNVGKVQSYTVDPDGAGPAPTFTLSNPDFRTQSLRGNAVVRWEYRPGSALFFVWQQQRSAFTPFEGDFQFRRDTQDIFGR